VGDQFRRPRKVVKGFLKGRNGASGLDVARSSRRCGLDASESDGSGSKDLHICSLMAITLV